MFLTSPISNTLCPVRCRNGCHRVKVLARPRDAQRYPHTVAMAAKFETEQGKIDYRKRKWIAEPPNGWIKNVLGFRQFSMRRLQKAQAEFKLVCMALNLRRMGAMQAC